MEGQLPPPEQPTELQHAALDAARQRRPDIGLLLLLGTPVAGAATAAYLKFFEPEFLGRAQQLLISFVHSFK